MDGEKNNIVIIKKHLLVLFFCKFYIVIQESPGVETIFTNPKKHNYAIIGKVVMDFLMLMV